MWFYNVIFTIIWTGRAGQVGAGGSGAGSGGSRVGGLVRRVAGRAAGGPKPPFSLILEGARVGPATRGGRTTTTTTTTTTRILTARCPEAAQGHPPSL